MFLQMKIFKPWPGRTPDVGSGRRGSLLGGGLLLALLGRLLLRRLLALLRHFAGLGATWAVGELWRVAWLHPANNACAQPQRGPDRLRSVGRALACRRARGVPPTKRRAWARV